MYLKKQTKTNIEGSIAWLEQKLKENPDYFHVDGKHLVKFLQSILENK